MSNVSIESDGTSHGTKVYVDDDFIKGITKLKIVPMDTEESLVKIVLEIDRVKLGRAVNGATKAFVASRQKPEINQPKNANGEDQSFADNQRSRLCDESN